MKLNQDCIRDLLLYLEDNLSYKNDININSLKLNNYTEEELVYTTERLMEANFLSCLTAKGFDIPVIIARNITYNGHEFLDNIRDDKVWKETKSIASTVASTSIQIISNIAAQVIANIVSKQIGLN